jgi:predicted PurR-regulated permease PerM
MPRKVEISHKTIIFTVAFLGLLWFLFFIKDIVLQLFVALVLMSVLNPLISKLSKFKIPKGISVLISYVLIFGFLGLAIATLLPPLVEQTTNLANNLPKYLQDLGINKYANGEVLKQVISQLGTLPGQIVKAGFSLFTNILSILTIAIFAFYLLLMKDKFDQNLEPLFGKEKSKGISILVNRLENRLGGWARGQLFLMLLVGILSYVGFIILGIPYALPLAMLSGLFEIVPFIGPVIAAIPAIILGFSISPFVGLATIALAFLIQQLENYVFVPKIMEKSTGVSPIVTLLALAIGSRLAGIVGMIISIPLVIIAKTLLEGRFGKE